MILQNRQLARLGLLSAFAIIISYVETLIPINLGIPGVKPGFANMVIIVALYLYGIREAGIINFIRILVVGFMFGNVISIVFSIAGAIFSLIIMWIIKRIPDISMIVVSICGGVAHNIGQIMAAMFITTVYSLTYYIPFLIISGIITGAITGIIAQMIQSRCINH